MSAYKEYGGYMEMEFGYNQLYHSEGLYLNSARHALKYIIRAHNIKKVAVAYFTCPVIWQAIEEEGCEIIFFDVNKNMEPKIEHISKNDFIICNNYFGIHSKTIKQLAIHYPNLIIDNAQAFFSPAYGLAAFYSPRKFFGLPDGGIALTAIKTEEQFETDISFERCTHLLKRHDLGASAAYSGYCDADNRLDTPVIKYMSNLTQRMLAGINYEHVKIRRKENFAHLHHHLSAMNDLCIDITEEDVPMAYPLLVENDNFKEILINKKIYVPTYWPQLEKRCPTNSNAIFLKKNLIPLPLDQRYSYDDIAEMLKIVKPVLLQKLV